MRATGETLAAIEEEFEFFRRVNEEFIDRSKGLLVKLEPFGGEVSGQVTRLLPLSASTSYQHSQVLNVFLSFFLLRFPLRFLSTSCSSL